MLVNRMNLILVVLFHGCLINNCIKKHTHTKSNFFYLFFFAVTSNNCRSPLVIVSIDLTFTKSSMRHVFIELIKFPVINEPVMNVFWWKCIINNTQTVKHFHLCHSTLKNNSNAFESKLPPPSLILDCLRSLLSAFLFWET